jgi:hypothetical protein
MTGGRKQEINKVGVPEYKRKREERQMKKREEKEE